MATEDDDDEKDDETYNFLSTSRQFLYCSCKERDSSGQFSELGCHKFRSLMFKV